MTTKLWLVEVHTEDDVETDELHEAMNAAINTLGAYMTSLDADHRGWSVDVRDAESNESVPSLCDGYTPPEP